MPLRLAFFFTFFLFSSPSPNWLANAFGLWKSKAKLPGNCEHVRKSLDNAAFWKCGDSSRARGSAFRAVNMQNAKNFTLKCRKRFKTVLGNLQTYEEM